MAEEKVYEPETIPDQPLPNEEEVASVGAGAGVGETYSPTSIKEKVIAKTKVARVLISDSLDTLSKRILGTFQFGKVGAIQIGEQKQGESGDIKISPVGIVARDQAGKTTFALDGGTGNATFKGTVQAGSVISESELIGGSININDKFTVDGEGNIVAHSIALAEIDNSTVGALNQAITSGSRTDVTGASLSFSLERKTIVLLIADVRFWTYQASGSGDWAAQGVINFDVDGAEKDGAIRTHGAWVEEATIIYGSAGALTPGSMHRIETLAAGNHTIKLQAYLSGSANNGALNIYNYKMSLITLGTAL